MLARPRAPAARDGLSLVALKTFEALGALGVGVALALAGQETLGPTVVATCAVAQFRKCASARHSTLEQRPGTHRPDAG